MFVAAQNRHIEIVRYLIGKGADVNGGGTRLHDGEGPTPLQGVMNNCNYPEFIRANLPNLSATVKAIALLLLESGADPNATDGCPIDFSSSFCDTDVTTALVQHGLKLNHRDHLGDTILHHCIKQEWPFRNPQERDRAMALVKLLVNNGADLMARDSQGFTPILIAATNGTWTVLDYMLERDEIVSKEKIDALELAAATILPSNNWNSEQERAFKYLRHALLLRQMEADPFPMTPLKLKRGRTIGWTTSPQLEQVIAEPAEYQVQSYLIQLRILSDRSHEASTTRRFLSGCILYLKNQNRLDDLVDVLWATFEKIQLHLLDSHHENGLWRMADDVVENLIWVLSRLGKNDPLYNADTFRSILKMELVTDRVHSQFCSKSNSCCTSPKYPSHMDILLQLVTFLAGIADDMLCEETQVGLIIKEFIYL